MRFCGYVCQDLEGEGDADEWAAELGQEAVVVAASASEAVALGSECHTGDDGEVDGGEVGVESSERLLYAVSVAGGKGLFAFVAVERQLIANDGGQEDGLSLVGEVADEGVGANLVGQGMVEEDGLAMGNCLDAFKQCACDALAVGLELLAGMLLFSFPDECPDFLFCHRRGWV